MSDPSESHLLLSSDIRGKRLVDKLTIRAIMGKVYSIPLWMCYGRNLSATLKRGDSSYLCVQPGWFVKHDSA
jgi:hypothetical protein